MYNILCFTIIWSCSAASSVIGRVLGGQAESPLHQLCRLPLQSHPLSRHDESCQLLQCTHFTRNMTSNILYLSFCFMMNLSLFNLILLLGMKNLVNVYNERYLLLIAT